MNDIPPKGCETVISCNHIEGETDVEFRLHGLLDLNLEQNVALELYASIKIGSDDP